MADNPIYYSDLIKDDGAIDKAIQSLNDLKSTYTDMASTVKKHAAELLTEIKKVTSVTDDGRKTTSKASDDATRLANAHRELKFALSEVGAQVVDLKVQTAAANKENRQSAEYINARTNSYNELKTYLTALVSSYKKLTKEEALNSAEGQRLLTQIIETKTQLSEIDKTLKLTTNSTKSNTAAVKQQKVVLTEVEKARQKLAFATSQENIEVMSLMSSVREANQVAKLNAIVANEAETSYNRLSAQYSLNKIAINKLTLAERENTVAGKELVIQTNEIYQKMIGMQEITGKHTLSVGNYAKTWDGLGNSVNQIVREVPAAAVSINTFFLAISNNVPIFVDEVNRMRVANVALAAEGKATTSIFKSILGSVFSFNTGIIVLLTVFAMFGKDIINFIAGLFKSKKALEDNVDAVEKYNQVMLEGRKNAQQEITHLKLLYEATQDQTKSYNERNAAVAEIKKLYPDYFKDLSEESILAGKAADSYIILASAILKSAMARAAEDKIVENSKAILDAQTKLNKFIIDLRKFEDEQSKRMKSGQGSSFSLGFKIENQRDIINEYVAFVNKLKSENEKLADGIDINSLLFDASGKEDGKKGSSSTKKDNDETLKLMREHTDSIIANINDEYAKRESELKTAYTREKTELQAKLDFDKTLTSDAKDAINGIIVEKAETLNTDLAEVDRERQERIYELNDALLEAEQIYIEDKLQVVKEGTEQENQLRIELLSKMKERELLENEQLTSDIKKNEADIIARYDELINQQNISYLRESQNNELKQKQEFDESEFNLIKRTEREKTIFKLQQEKERWVKLLELAKLGIEDLSDVEIQSIKNMIDAIDREIGEAEDVSILEKLGINLDSKQQSSLKEAASIVINNFKEIAQAQLDAADAAVEAADARVEASQTALDAEIEARNQGYAFNVTAAQKELAEARRIQTEKLKLQEEASKRQRKLDSIAQASSLITASANIWQAFSGIPVIGPVLALAAMGVMWGSFALSKVKANKLTKEQETYGDGTFEILDGGSHASGNDISLGTTKTGKQRRAEGGEAFAVINKRNTAKYRSVLPDIVSSINKGVFEHKYMKSYDTDMLGVTMNGTIVDLSKLESSVNDIRSQNMKKYHTDQNGNLVVTYKNLKTIIHAN